MSRQNQHDVQHSNNVRHPAAGGQGKDVLEMAGLVIGAIVILLLTVTM